MKIIFLLQFHKLSIQTNIMKIKIQFFKALSWLIPQRARISGEEKMIYLHYHLSTPTLGNHEDSLLTVS